MTMKAVRGPFLLVLAFLALLPAGLSSPAVADWGNISVIALRGQTVIPPAPAPTITLADFGPPDIDMNTWANIVDVLKFKPYIMTSVSPSPSTLTPTGTSTLWMC